MDIFSFGNGSILTRISKKIFGRSFVWPFYIAYRDEQSVFGTNWPFEITIKTRKKVFSFMWYRSRMDGSIRSTTQRLILNVNSIDSDGGYALRYVRELSFTWRPELTAREWRKK